MQFAEFSHRFVVKFLSVRRFVEIEVSAEYFVGTFAREHHLDAHRLDDASEQIHRSGCAHGGYVVGFDVINHVANGVEALLNGIIYFVVNSSDEVSHLASGGKVGSTFKSHGKRVQTRPPSLLLTLSLDASARELIGDSRDNRRVEATREKHAIRHVAHELTLHCIFEGIAKAVDVRHIVLNRAVIGPRAVIPTLHGSRCRGVDVTRQERFDFLAVTLERLEFGSEESVAIVVETHI